MGFVSGLFEQRASSFKVSQDPPDWYAGAVGAWDSFAGVNLTPELAMTFSAVYACVNVIAQTVASLPLITYRRMKRGRERAYDFYLYSILHDLPNPEMTSYDLRMAMQGHLGLRGNCFAEIVSDGAGRVSEIWPLRPDRMTLKRAPNGELLYVYTLPQSVGGGEKAFRKDQIWHIRGLSSNGLVGLSPIGQAMQGISLGLAMEEFGGRFFGSGAQPGFLLKHPTKMSDEAYKRLRKSWEERISGLGNAHRVAILEEGVTTEKIGIAPEEAQFLESRKFQIRDIARFYRMQPHKIQDLEQATFSNIEHQSIEFVTDTIRPWLVAWEQAIYKDILLVSERKKYYTEHLVDGLLRGDTKSRYEAYGSAINAGWMVRNEAREKENMNPIDGLDEPLTPLNMMNGTDGTGPDEGKRDLRAFEAVMEDVFARMSKREAQDLAAAIKKGGDLKEWAERYYREFQDFAERQLRPVFIGIADFRGISAAEAVDYAIERALILAENRRAEIVRAVEAGDIGPDGAEKRREMLEKSGPEEAKKELERIPWRDGSAPWRIESREK